MIRTGAQTTPHQPSTPLGAAENPLSQNQIARTSTAIDLSSAIVRLPPPSSVLKLISGEWSPRLEHRELELAQVELRDHLATTHAHWFNSGIDSNNVLLTLGVRDGLCRLSDASPRIKRGIAIPAPCYTGYFDKLAEIDVPVRTVPLSTATDRTHHVDIDRISKEFSRPQHQDIPAAGAVLIAAPNTPTNTYPVPSELLALSHRCDSSSRYLLLDNTFDTFDATNPWRSMPLSSHSTILLGSISESYSLSQYNMSIGYIIAPKPIIESLRTANRHSRAPFQGPDARALIAANLSTHVMERYLEERTIELRTRHAVASQLAQIPGVVWLSGESGTTKWVAFETTELAYVVTERLARHGITIKSGADYARAPSGAKKSSVTPNATLSRHIRISLVTQPTLRAFAEVFGKVAHIISEVCKEARESAAQRNRVPLPSEADSTGIRLFEQTPTESKFAGSKTAERTRAAKC